MITYVKGTRDIGECTGTAIAPHAIMTATHCTDHGTNTLHLDYSTRIYTVQKVLTDGRDHDIYLIDGPALKNLVTYRTREAKEGEHVYMYGDGEGQYPSRRLDGSVIPTGDPSDVDAEQKERAFTLHVIPGDSGSAIYADDGSIIALTTYTVTSPGEHFWNKDFVYCVGFQPGFTQDQILQAQSFVPLPDAPKEQKPMTLKDFMSLF